MDFGWIEWQLREVADEDGQEMAIAKTEGSAGSGSCLLCYKRVYCLLFRREENKKPLILDSMDGVD
uniref:Uncharacterized protein n=1 Tax=Oryza nivara TaxID=4536 RepID=A0A0E0IQ77_ORYNI